MKVLFAKLPFSQKGKIFTIRIFFCFCMLLFAEIFLFNLKSITGNKEDYGVEFSGAWTNTPETVEISENGVCFHGDGEVVFGVNRENVNAIQLHFSGEEQRFLCSAAIADDNFSQEYIVAARKYTSCDYGKFDTSFLSYGELKEVKISLSGVDSDVFIDNCELSTSLPFHFSWLRFLSLFALAVLVCAIVSFKLYTYDYNKKSAKQQKVIWFLMIISALLLCSFYNPEQKAVKYSDSDLTYSDPYTQMFDSFYSGRLSLKAEAPQELAEIDNPYDRSLRESVVGHNYYWDRAYYDGEYYSYFGATPVLLFYFPFYLISGGYVPTTNMACIFFGILAIIFMYGTVLAFVDRFAKKVNFLLLCAILASSVFISGLAWLVNYSCFYVVPPVASTCFLFLCLWTGISACGEKAKYKQCVLFAICGLAFVLCFESRATKAFSALVLAPLFIGILLDKKLSVKRRVACVISFLVPVVLGLAAVMAYNYARFDSPFEFGSTYQLTLSDIHANTVTWKLFLPAMVHFFLQPMTISDVFPYFDFTIINTANYGKYMCTESSVGLLMYPLLCLGILIFPFLLYSLRKNKKEKYRYNNDRIRNYTYALMMVIIVFVSWMDFCVGGIVIRYVTDVMPLATLLSAWCLLETYYFSEKVPVLKKKVLLFFVLAAFVTVILGYSQVLWQPDGETNLYHPRIISVLEELICFWN